MSRMVWSLMVVLMLLGCQKDDAPMHVTSPSEDEWCFTNRRGKPEMLPCAAYPGNGKWYRYGGHVGQYYSSKDR